MTEPAGAPGAPATTPPATTPPAPPSPLNMPPHQPTGTPPADGGQDVASLPDWAQATIRDLRSEAGKARTTAKQNAADEAKRELAAQVAKALGIQTGDTPPDPAQLTAQVEAAKQQALESALHLAVHRAAGTAGANPDALLDSMSFINSLDDSVTADPGTAEFSSQIAAAVKSWTDSHPQLKAGPAPASRSSAPITGGSGEGAPITQEQLDQMTEDQITEALKSGRLSHLM